VIDSFYSALLLEGLRGGSLSLISFGSLLMVIISGVVGVIPFVAAGNALGFFRFGFQSFADAFKKLPEREKSWGTVYDSRTLRPLPFAVVRMFGDDRRLLKKRVADGEGRFGFLASPAGLHESTLEVELVCEAPGYVFPAQEKSGNDALLYGSVYRGGSIMIKEGALVNVDIPMDARRPVSEGQKAPAPSVKAGVATAAMADSGFWIGLVAVPLAFILEPNAFSMGVLFLYAGTASLRLFGIGEHPFGTVSDEDEHAVPFALVTLHDDSGVRVSYAVSDERGRYFMAVEKGSYVISVHTPANVSPPRDTEKPIVARKGWVTLNLQI